MALKKSVIKLIGIAAVLLLAGLLLISWLATRQAPVSTPTVDQLFNLDETRTKAEAGDPQAQKNLGTMYARGQGVAQSYAEAAKWHREAADKGHAGAQVALAELYEAGRGVAHDDSQAAQWYRRAAEQGNAVGEYNLALLYVLGKGVPQDNAKALEWYRKSADQGLAVAQYNLGIRHYRSQAVAQDLVEAYKWLSLAAAQAMPDAVQARDEIKGMMTHAQISEGRRRASAFVTIKPAQNTP